MWAMLVLAGMAMPLPHVETEAAFAARLAVMAGAARRPPIAGLAGRMRAAFGAQAMPLDISCIG